MESNKLLDRDAAMTAEVRNAPWRDRRGPFGVRTLNRLQAIRQDILLTRRRGEITPAADSFFARRLDHVQHDWDQHVRNI